MILHETADFNCPVGLVIPVLARVGNVSVSIAKIRHARGIMITTTTTAVAGTGSYRVRLQCLIEGYGNTAYVDAAYSTFIGNHSRMFYPGTTITPAGTSFTYFADTKMTPDIVIQLENSSAVPGNECTTGVRIAWLI